MAAQNLYNIGLFTNIGAVSIPSYVDFVASEGFSVAGLGSATYFVTSDAANGVTVRASLDGRKWKLCVYQVYPEMVGAKADGATDDASAINSALAFAPLVKLTAATYAIGSPVNLLRGNTLSGDFKTFDDQTGNGSKLFLLAGANCSLITTPASRQVASFTIAIAGTTATVSAATGVIEVNGQVNASGIANFTLFTAQLTGPAGGAGTYSVNNSQTLGSRAGTSNGGPTNYQRLEALVLDGNATNQTQSNFAINAQALFVGSEFRFIFVKNNRGPWANIERCDLKLDHIWALKNVCIAGELSAYAMETNWGINSILIGSINANHIYIENTLNVVGGDRANPAQRGYGINLNRISAFKMPFWNAEGTVTAIDFTSCGVVEIGVADSTAMGYNTVTDAAFYRFMDASTKQFKCGKIIRQGFETGMLAVGKATGITSDYIPNVSFNGSPYFPGYEFNADPTSLPQWLGRSSITSMLGIWRVGTAGFSELKFGTNQNADMTEYVAQRGFGSGLFWNVSNRLQPTITGAAATVAGAIVQLDGTPDISKLMNLDRSQPVITLANATNGSDGGTDFNVIAADPVSFQLTLSVNPTLSGSPTAWTIKQQEVSFWGFQSYGNGADCAIAYQPMTVAYRGVTTNMAEGAVARIGTTDTGPGAVFTASFAGTNMTATSMTNGQIVIGQHVQCNGIAAETYIQSQTSGLPGQAGVYVTTQANTLASRTVTTYTNSGYEIILNSLPSVISAASKNPGAGAPTRKPYYNGEEWWDPSFGHGGSGATWRGVNTASTTGWYLKDQGFDIGTTAQRPALGTISKRYQYFDTDLAAAGKPIWWTGTQWIDATGTVV